MIVSGNFAGRAVSRQIIGTSRSICASATLIPSAVCGSTMTPYRSNVVRIVRIRSLWVLRPDISPLAPMRAKSESPHMKLAARIQLPPEFP